jgi:methylglyoxal synthase
MSKIIGLVAHDQKKPDLADWVGHHKKILAEHRLFATGTTGGVIRTATGLDVTLLKSGPWGGDAQLGAMIAEERLDMLIFFIDPLSSMPHDVDVKALIRLATLYNVPFACNRATATAVLRSL